MMLSNKELKELINEYAVIVANTNIEHKKESAMKTLKLVRQELKAREYVA